MKNNAPPHGRRAFSPRLTFIVPVIAAFLTTTATRADDLTFTSPVTRLSGSVTAIRENGTIELQSPHAPQPLLLKPGALQQITFSGNPAASATPQALVRLTNGDTLPVSIESLNDRTLVATSPDAGRLEIPRALIEALRPGVPPASMIYSGPTPDGWKSPKNLENSWKFENGKFKASGPAEMSRNLSLPARFTLRLKLKWDSSPNFQLHFADPLLPKGSPADRYLLRFSGAGIDLKRESTTGKRYTDLAVLNRLPSQFPESELLMEVRADLTAQTFQIFLNGEPEGTFPDPVAPGPTGTGMSVVSTIEEGDAMEILSIHLLAGNDAPAAAPTPSKPSSEDHLTTREDDEWSGKLLEILPSPQGALFRFQPKTADAAPIEIPVNQIAAVTFAKPASTETPPPATAAPAITTLRLHGGAALAVGPCRFDGNDIATSHPLLGDLRLPKDRVAAIEFHPAAHP